MVKVDWPKPKDGGLRMDLEAVAFAEYIVGAQPGRPNGTGRGLAENAKGQGLRPVQMFASFDRHKDPDELEKETKAFHRDWLSRSPKLAGHDADRWTAQQGWCVHLLRRPVHAKRFRRTSAEQRQYRIRLCPETTAGVALAQAGRLEDFARRFMAGLERDFGGQLTWIGAEHHNTDQPHVHIGMRGVSVEGEHVFFPQSYLRPTLLELKRNPAASSPIEWRARAVLAEMMLEMGGKRAAG